MDPNSTQEADPEKAGQRQNNLTDTSPATIDPALSDSYSPTEERLLLRHQDLTILPLSAFIYFLCYLDRSNIGNARILNSSTHHDMQTTIGATQHQFNVTLMIFQVGYALFEVPSNILLKKLRPSRWLAFLMFSWGAITMGLGGVHSFPEAAGVRFLLGVFEAGLFPGLVYYLTFWYRSDERSVRVAFILSMASLASAFGGTIAYGIGHMNLMRGLEAWRWLFIIEGAPSCVSAALVWWLLPDFPEEFLKGRQKDVAVARLRVEGSKRNHRSMTRQDAKSTLAEWRLYGHYLMQFGLSVPFGSLSLFVPFITAGLGYVDLQAQLMTVPPYAAAYVCQLLVSHSADRFNARGLHIATFASIGAVGFMAAALLPPDAYLHRYGCLIVSTAGTFASAPPMLGWLSSNVHTTASVGLAIAISVSLGAGIGSIPGMWIYKAEERDRGFPTGNWVNAGMLFMVAMVAVGLRMFYGYKNRQLVRESCQEARLYKL
ncbi:MFS general substrate transporter [Parathielavia appendiculata]|uniref:MFS general substrate transporter n=1 Tax=Parathielavia appendiculata TaxID=2587402 RepID=A0AAN6Z3Z5_9PEZI|nr:MFS general substrate transporter [Parathielavia appendiculata]